MHDRPLLLAFLVLGSSCTCRGPGTVGVSPDLTVVPTQLEFRPTLVGTRRTLPVTIHNGARIAATVELASDGPFHSEDSRLEIEAGGDASTSIAFVPQVAVHFEGTIQLTVGGNTVALPVSGDAVECVSGACDLAAWDDDAAQCVQSALPNGRTCKTACGSLGQCHDGICAGGDLICDDHDLCTADICDPAAGCAHLPSTDGCPRPTSACSMPTCESPNGCGFAPAPDGVPCEDGCTVGTCQAGSCVGSPRDCDDHNLCTEDSCGADGECIHDDVTASCPNASPCTAPVCDPQSGCGVASAHEGMRCDAAPSCAGPSICVKGECVTEAQPPPIDNGCTCNDVRRDHELAIGLRHACRRTASSGVECWGDNEYGELGDGTFVDHHSPAPVQGLSNVVELTAAGLTTCARTSDGEVYCWGRNAQAQVAATSLQKINSPTRVILPKKAVSITINIAQLVCAALEDGSVWCWGEMSLLVGYQSFPNPSPPTEMPGFSNVIQVGAHWYDLCALKANGTVQCIGGNVEGELGDGTRWNRNSPVSPIESDGGLLTKVVEIAMGPSSPGLCVRTLSREVKCAMRNGPPNSTATSFPEPGLWLGHVELGGCATQLGRGTHYACARMGDGTARCFGRLNSYGQLGTGSTAVPPDWMSDVSQLSGVTEIQGGYLSTCANLEDGGFVCWGDNTYGQLGDGTTTTRFAP